MRAEKPSDSIGSQAGKYLGVGMTWALSTALFLYLGKLVDGRFGTRPWFTLIGALVGAVAGFYYLWHSLAADTPRSKREETK